MSFDWTQYIRLAEDLIKDNPNGARIRSATSRAYYGAFISCRNYKEFSSRDKKEIHRKVIDSYKLSGIKEELLIGNLLDDLRMQRGIADYNGISIPTTIKTKKDIENAKKIIEKLDELKEES